MTTLRSQLATSEEHRASAEDEGVNQSKSIARLEALRDQLRGTNIIYVRSGRYLVFFLLFFLSTVTLSSEFFSARKKEPRFPLFLVVLGTSFKIMNASVDVALPFLFYVCGCLSSGDLESALSDAQQLRSERDATKRALSKRDQDFLAEQVRESSFVEEHTISVA